MRFAACFSYQTLKRLWRLIGNFGAIFVVRAVKNQPCATHRGTRLIDCSLFIIMCGRDVSVGTFSAPTARYCSALSLSLPGVALGLPFTLPASMPQAAEMSSPRLRRMVQVTP